jgi:hypothetical protein
MRCALITAGLVLSCAKFASAHLGSFTNADGYYPQYGTVLGDVTYSNAGANGANSGGGAAAAIAADSGLWKLQTSVGGVFGTAANRAAFAATFPAYNPTPPNTVAAYMVGGHFPGHTGDNANLAFRNDTPVGTGAARYRYSIDTYDTGGPVPASVTAGPVSMQFYFVPNLHDNSNASGGPPADKFTMSLLDSAGKVGLQWGYARDNTVTWRPSSAGPWNYTSVTADDFNWDGVKFNLDLTADTFGIDYFDASANTWANLVPAGTPMGANMANFTNIDWQLEDGTGGSALSIAGKNYYDDFGFSIPEPSSMAAIGLATIGLLRRGRR